MGADGQLRVALLGTFQVLLPDGSEADFKTDGARVLLAWLTFRLDVPQRRDVLATLLRPDVSDASARNYLRTVLGYLRKALGDQQAPRPYLEGDRKSLTLLGEQIWLDSAEFNDHLDQVKTHTHRRLAGCNHCIRHLTAAADLYRGELLAGLHYGSEPWETWLVAQRTAISERALNTLQQLTELHFARQEWESTLHYARRQLAIEPWRESAHQAIIRAYRATHRQDAALKQHQRYRQTLWDELGVEATPFEQLAYSRVAHKQPAQATTAFFGRMQTLDKLETLLNDPRTRFVTLLGEGGIGKTRLAQEAARRLQHTFADGVSFVSLAGVQPASDPLRLGNQVAQVIATTLDFQLDGKETRSEQLILALSQQARLLILDNCEHLLDSADFLVDLLQRAPHIVILATSRELFNLAAEQIVGLTGLPQPPADSKQTHQQRLNQFACLRLFLDRAQRLQTHFTSDEESIAHIGHICRLLGGNPLGIELAAAWVGKRTLVEIADSISATLDFLATRRRDLPTRHRSMRAVFTHSWNLLTENEQQVLAKLSVFRGGFLAAAVEAIVGATQFDLDSLIDKSLIQRDLSGCYQMHTLLRQFSAEKLPQDSTIRRKHADYFISHLAIWGQALEGRNPKQAREALDADLDNIRHAWQWGIDQNPLPTLHKALSSFKMYFDIARLYNEALQHIIAAIDKIGAAETTDTVLRLQLAQAHFLKLKGAYAEALTIQRGVLALAIPDSLLQAQIALALAATLTQYDETEAAVEMMDTFGAMLNRLEESGGNSAEIAYLRASEAHQHALIRRGQGRFANALPFNEQALKAWQQLGNQLRVADALWLMGSNHRSLVNLDLSRRYLHEAMTAYRAMNHLRGEGHALSLLGMIEFFYGSLEQAESFWNAARRIYTAGGNVHDQWRTISYQAACQSKRGGWDKSIKLQQQLIEAYEQVNNREALSTACINISNLYIEVGMWQMAEHYLDWSYRIEEPRERQIGLISLFNVQSHLAYSREQYALARHLAQNAIHIAERYQTETIRKTTLYHLGRAQLALGALEAAHESFSMSLAMMQKGGNSAEMLRPYTGLVYVALARNDHEAIIASAKLLRKVLESVEAAAPYEYIKPYYALYRAAAATNDVNASTYLQNMIDHITQQSNLLQDSSIRRSYLNLPLHQHILQLGQDVEMR